MAGWRRSSDGGSRPQEGANGSRALRESDLAGALPFLFAAGQKAKSRSIGAAQVGVSRSGSMLPVNSLSVKT